MKKGEAIDARATAQIVAAGWDVATHGPRFVASKRVIEDDHSITRKFESTYTLEGLARNVKRREREESNENRRSR